MKIKYIFGMIIIVIIIFSVGACIMIFNKENKNKNGYSNIPIVDDLTNTSSKYDDKINNQFLISNITNVIDIEKYNYVNLPYKITQSMNIARNLKSIDELLETKCIFKKNGNRYYSVTKFKSKANELGYCFMLYYHQSDDLILIDSWFVVKIPDKSKFKQIKSNKTTFSDIKQLDPAAIIYDGDKPFSYHRFLEGTAIEIRYTKDGDSYIVKDYVFEKDPVAIVRNLLPIDLELIKWH